MTLTTMLTETVTIYTRSTSTQDSSGVDIETFTPGSPVSAFVIRSGGAQDETVGGRDLVRSDWSFITYPDVTVTAYDRVLIGTQMTEVIGQPRKAMLPGSGAHHLIVAVRFLED